MKKHGGKQPGSSKSLLRSAFFPLSVLVIYGLCFVCTPDKAFQALENSARIARQLIRPLCMVFIVITLMNRFLKPSRIAGFLGKNSGVLGILFATVAGIFSMGPIYAWYPLLKDLRDRGAGNGLIAIFLCNRVSVKPFLLPVMVTCFGWQYTAILTVLGISGSLVVGFLINAWTKDAD